MSASCQSGHWAKAQGGVGIGAEQLGVPNYLNYPNYVFCADAAGSRFITELWGFYAGLVRYRSQNSNIEFTVNTTTRIATGNANCQNVTGQLIENLPGWN